MAQELTSRGRGLGVSALVLRLGLAAVLGGTGYQWLQDSTELAARPEAAAPFDPASPVQLPPTTAENVTDASPTALKLERGSVELRLPWRKVGGAVLMGAAGLFALGLGTRWLALGGVAALTTETLVESGLVSASWLAPLTQAITGDAVTGLLLQVILLALLVSGSGTLGCDRLWARRRAARRRPTEALLAA